MTTAAPRFSLRFNNDLTVREAVAAARRAEAAGFDQFWISNDLFLRSAPVLLSAVATATERIHVGSCILNPYSVDPAEIAMIAATLQELSGGRFLLGVAAGAGDFLDWIGLGQGRPLTRMQETLDVLRRLLAGQRAALDGTELRWTADCYLRFDPLAGGDLPPVPVYLGANGPRMLELAGASADGVLPLLFPPEHWDTVRPLVAAGEERRPSELAEVDVAACVWVSIDADPERARLALAEKIAYYGHSLSPLIFERLGLDRGDFVEVFDLATRGNDLEAAARRVTPEMLRVGITGGPGEVVERLSPLLARGARHLSFGPPLGPDPLAAIDLLGARVLPALRGTER